MKISDAYEIVKKIKGNNILVDCRDFSETWGFAFTNKVLPSDEIMLGSGYYTVHKETGCVNFFAVTEILNLLAASSSIMPSP